MTDREWRRWWEANLAVLGNLRHASSPCQDCTVEFAKEMREQGCCDGWPGSPRKVPSVR